MDSPAGRTADLRWRAAMLNVAGVLIVVASMRHGGFYRPDDLLVPTIALAVAAVGIAATWRYPQLTARDWVAIGALLLLTLWWYLDAKDQGVWPLARQGAGAAIGFAACLATGRSLDDVSRVALRGGAVIFGSLTAAIGLVGMAFQISPLALPAQGQLRLAGPITYSNATGALLAMLAVVAIAAPATRSRNAQLVLISGGLAATQSRAAVLALLVSLVLVRRHLPAAVVPLGLGAVVGAVAVAGSGDRQDHVGLLVVAVAAAAVASAVPPQRVSARWLVAIGVAGVLVVGAVALVSDGLQDAVRKRVGTASVSDRDYEWHAGWDAFTASPWTGAGPGNRLHLSDGRTARFTHNEPLQVATDTGLIGVALLTVAFAASLLRSRELPRVDAGAAVLVVFLGCGVLDFPWHLPAITMTAGLLIAGLPHKPTGYDEHEPTRTLANRAEHVPH